MEKIIEGLTCKNEKCGFNGPPDEFIADYKGVVFCPCCYSDKIADSAEVDTTSADESAETKPVIIDEE